MQYTTTEQKHSLAKMYLPSFKMPIGYLKCFTTSLPTTREVTESNSPFSEAALLGNT
jgi:hypothetical protein